jgi:hypothetical protein
MQKGNILPLSTEKEKLGTPWQKHTPVQERYQNRKNFPN